MIPDAIFLRLAAGFAKPTPEELVVLQQQQQVLFEEGTTLSLHELALQSGFLSDTEAAEFLAVAGGEPGEDSAPPAAGNTKAPSGRAKVPSGRTGVKAPSGRAKAPSGRAVKAPSGRAKVPSGRTGTPSGRAGVKSPSGRTGTPSGRTGATGRLAQRGASGRHPAPKKSPVIPVLLGAVVVGCVAGAVLLSRTPPSDGGGTAEVQHDADAPKTAEDFLGRARELHASVGARLRDGEGERVLQEVQALRREWTSIPAAKAALGELEELERDLQDELERLRAGQREDDPPPTSGDADDEDERELDLPPPPQPPVAPEGEPEDDPDVDVEGPADPPLARVDGERPQVPSVPLQDPVLEGTGPVALDPEDPTLEPSDPVVVGDTPQPRPSGPAAGKDPVASDPDVAEPGSRTDPVLPDEVSPDYDRALIAFVKDDDAELERLSAKLSGAKDPLEGAARGLVAFRARRFLEAYELLEPFVGLDSWTRDTFLRAGLFVGKFDEVRANLLADPKDVDPVLQELVLGPFARAYPHAARALERLSPKGHYRVMSDIGFTPQALDALEAELRDASPKSQESILRRVQKKHVTLNAAAEVMDKAFAAYDKLFGIERACEVVPTVYLFADSADFAAFSRRLEVGDTENTLGYYLPHYRVLVFYEQSSPKLGELSQPTLETLMHEAFHQWLHLYVHDAPPWFDEGLAEYFSTCSMSRSRLVYGLVPPMVGPSRLADIRDSLTGEGYYEPWPLKRLLVADHRDFMGSHPSLNYAHAWSFSHYLASTKDGRARLKAYFRGLRDGEGFEALYRRVFGDVPAEAFEKDFRTYVLQLKPS